jgi:uncharacterized protein YndB with AHSA1/START domain
MTVDTQTAQSKPSTDRIEKRVELRATQSRVWRALTNSREFGEWFGATFDREFIEGTTIRGQVTIRGYEHVKMEVLIDRIEPERYFSYRWHPAAIDPKVDYSAEPTTLVEFFLEEADGGTVLTIVESGFDKLPAGRRAEAFRMNESGWTGQIKNITRYVS